MPGDSAEDIRLNVAQPKKTPKQLLGKLAELLERSGVDISEVNRVQRVNVWQGFYKDADDNAVVVDMAGVALVPNWAEGPSWPVVQPAKVVRCSATRRAAKRTDGWKTAVVLPDLQIGYRYLRASDGSMYLSPFHDEAAIAVALALVASIRPDQIILLGDCLDLPAQSRFVQEPSWAATTQDAIDRFHLLLSELRALCPNAKIVVIEGNHDMRLPRSILVNAAAAFGLTRANMPTSWPVLTVPHLCRFDELGVSYVEGYPAGEYWINDNLACIHGRKIGNATKSAASRVVDDERVSIIFGHVHSMEYRAKTRRVFDGSKAVSKQSFAASPGCLCRIDGAVPGVKGGIDSWGRPLTSYENWQQGVAVVSYVPGNGRFSYEQVPIFDGSAVYRGRVFDAPPVKTHKRVAKSKV